MGEDKFGLDLFSQRLLDAASRRMDHLYPQWTQRHRDLISQGQVSGAAGLSAPPDSGRRFGDFRRLLTATYDLELSIHTLRISLRLLQSTPDPSSLAGLSMNEGEWEYYHYQMWAYSLAGVLERTKKLVAVTARSLLRPYGRNGYEAVIAELQSPIEQLRQHMKVIRDPLAHGGGPVEYGARQGLWEGMSAARIWPQMDRMLVPLAANRQNRHRMIEKHSVTAIAWVGKVMQRLADEIDWELVTMIPDPSAAPNPSEPQ